MNEKGFLMATEMVELLRTRGFDVPGALMALGVALFSMLMGAVGNREHYEEALDMFVKHGKAIRERAATMNVQYDPYEE